MSSGEADCVHVDCNKTLLQSLTSTGFPALSPFTLPCNGADLVSHYILAQGHCCGWAKLCTTPCTWLAHRHSVQLGQAPLQGPLIRAADRLECLPFFLPDSAASLTTLIDSSWLQLPSSMPLTSTSFGTSTEFWNLLSVNSWTCLDLLAWQVPLLDCLLLKYQAFSFVLSGSQFKLIPGTMLNTRDSHRSSLYFRHSQSSKNATLSLKSNTKSMGCARLADSIRARENSQ